MTKEEFQQEMKELCSIQHFIHDNGSAAIESGNGGRLEVLKDHLINRQRALLDYAYQFIPERTSA